MSRVVTIPTLETERLVLRALRLEDFEPLAAFYAGPRARFVGGPMTRQQAWSKFLSFLGMWTLHGYGMFAIEEKATGAFVGRTGLQRHDYAPEPEMAWSVLDGFEGRGYAFEATLAARDHVRETHGVDAPISLIDGANAASLALARRLGCVREAGDFAYPDGHVVQVWRHPARARLAAQ
ncbi:GNAT family N-acetyltransferase [Albimonas sp. CAU 1670]|uniref:GNAT family N-acetyltransferase n=1 Tax=Albimonas sp. CAU 1670 TaxID=3032599 RepID=UPI0023DC772E|nr:GNAT family N-acetyltransferase [Albimonas sp. CAU 1670]MDF2232484.1 GNAT family N-acetyltransferase [Albimonas sp. CAU 1670]